MFKKFFTYPVFLVLFLSFIGLMGFSSIIKYHYNGGQKYQFLQKPVMLIASVPRHILDMIKSKSLNPGKPPIQKKHKDKDRFKQFIKNRRNALLVLLRSDHDNNRAVVDIIDLNNCQILQTIKKHINKMNDKITKTK